MPPKAAVPPVAASKSEMAVLPESTSVGKAKFHHLYPWIASPLIGSLPFALEEEMKSSVTL